MIALRSRLFWSAILGIACGGCHRGPFYPVAGRLVDASGAPVVELAGAAVEFYAVDQPAASLGEIQADGTFRLTSQSENDGALPGPHRIAVARRYLDPERAAPRVIEARYEDPDTSGLEFTIEPKTNWCELRVDRIKQSAQPASSGEPAATDR